MGNENWVPAQTGWQQFCKENPGLGLAGTKSSFIWFMRTHGEQMLAAGVMRRTRSRHLMIDVTTFPKVAFDYYTGVSE